MWPKYVVLCCQTNTREHARPALQVGLHGKDSTPAPVQPLKTPPNSICRTGTTVTSRRNTQVARSTLQSTNGKHLASLHVHARPWFVSWSLGYLQHEPLHKSRKPQGCKEARDPRFSIPTYSHEYCPTTQLLKSIALHVSAIGFSQPVTNIQVVL